MRHAEQNWDRVTPNQAWPLTERGKQQARDVIDHLAGLGIQTVYSSSMVRARATVAPFCQRAGLTCNVEPGLEEREVCWPPPELEVIREYQHRSWLDLDYKVPGFESNREAQARFMRALSAIAARHLGERVLVCAHGNVIALAVHLLSHQPEPSELHLGFCEIRRLRFCDDGFRYDAKFRLLLPSGP